MLPAPHSSPCTQRPDSRSWPQFVIQQADSAARMQANLLRSSGQPQPAAPRGPDSNACWTPRGRTPRSHFGGDSRRAEHTLSPSWCLQHFPTAAGQDICLGSGSATLQLNDETARKPHHLNGVALSRVVGHRARARGAVGKATRNAACTRAHASSIAQHGDVMHFVTLRHEHARMPRGNAAKIAKLRERSFAKDGAKDGAVDRLSRGYKQPS